MTSKEATAPAKAVSSGELLRMIFAFLNRDVRSFLPTSTQEEMPTLESPAASVAEPIPPLVDPSNLFSLAFRREVLDWRDNFHVQVTLMVSALHEKFIHRIDAELNKVGFFRQLNTRSAREVLQGPFTQEVRVPLYSSLKLEEENRAAEADKTTAQWQFKFSFKMQWPESECDCLGDIKFKPTNRDAIILAIEAMMFGDSGVAAAYRDQATLIARKLIEEKQPC